MFRLFFHLLVAALINSPLFAAHLESHIPKEGVERFIDTNLDLSTFRNSSGPRRTPNARTFHLLGLSPTLAQDGKLQYDDSEWFYGVEVKGRKDYNGDGIEDLALCFTDRAKVGTYSDQKSLLVTRYSDNSLLIAIGYEVDACNK
jgi:hypothetical protein